jgi:ElaB/YqjD/DUF883 family membrane-anchored ribosome-binding protein
MSESADALAYKADVPARTRERMTAKKDELVSKVTGHTPDGGQVAGQAKGQAKRAKGLAEDNPLGLAVGAVAVGFLAGLLVPSTRIEDEKLGPMADEVKDRVREVGSEAVERGKQVASDAADAAKESGREHADELKSSAREQASDAGQAVRDR